MITALQTLVRSTDALVARLYLSLVKERPALSCFLFHSLFRDESEMARNAVDPLDRTTVAHLRELVQYYIAQGYRFVSPAEILAGLPAGEKVALITFDDGYYNNTLSLPVLHEFNAPALFFISTNHVREQKCFWWDVLYRELVAQGASAEQVQSEALALKYLRTEEIESRLLARFGPDALRPRCDVDRPFTSAELRDFAANPLVHLGNHTANHAILTNYTTDEMRRQIGRCQEDLAEMTGLRADSIAYPNGAYSDAVLTACADEGIRLGFTVRPQKNRLPLPPGDGLLTLGRFVPHADASITSQCRTYRSDLLLYGALRAAYLRIGRGRITN